MADVAWHVGFAGWEEKWDIQYGFGDAANVDQTRRDAF